MVNEESLVSISEASHILGVSEPALRQWTDEGKIKAFITPGGHRRYDRADLKKFVNSHPKMLGVKDLAIELEETAHQHRKIARASLESTDWYNKLNEESQAHPNAVLGSLLAGQERWNIPIHFLDDFLLAEEFVASMLSKYHAYRWLEMNGFQRCLIEGDI